MEGREREREGRKRRERIEGKNKYRIRYLEINFIKIKNYPVTKTKMEMYSVASRTIEKILILSILRLIT